MNKHIKRHELLALFNKGLAYPLVLMVAPPGSGKSVLLEQWAAKQSNSDALCKVLQFQASSRLDEGNALFALIFETLKNITPLWDAPFFRLFNDDSDVTPDKIIEVFIDAFKQFDQPLAIIFDDFHHIKNPRIHKTLESLITQLPSHVTLILSSRRYPQFSISKLKLQESVLLIDSNDLKLDKDDLLTLNNTIGGSSLQPDRVHELLEQTEGWFVGTKLALLAYDKTGDTALDSFSGSQPELLNYFGHEVLSKLTPELKRFVLSTAICKSFNQALCEDVLGIDYSAAKLEEISMQELFVSPDPTLAGGYRYHPLLQDFLLKRLEIEEGPAHIKGLHYRVAEYFLQQHDLSAAIYHAYQSGEKDFYFKILEDACAGWVKQGELELVVNSLVDISNDDFSQHPELLIYQLYALAFTRRFNQASFFLKQLHLVSAHDSDRFKAHYQFFKYLLVLFQNDNEVLTPDSKHPKSLNTAPQEVIGFIKVLQAYALMCNGYLSKAFRLANEAKHILKQLQHHFFESFANLVIILCDRYLGRGVEAIQLMNEVFLPIKNSKRTPLWSNLATGMMVVEYEQNRLDQSLVLSAQLMPLVNHSCATEEVASVYLYSARIFHVQGQTSKAKRLLDQLERILSLGNYQRFNSQVIHEKMRQAFVSGEFTACEYIYEKYQLSDVCQKGRWQKAERYEECSEKQALAAMYYLVSKSRYKQAHELLENLAQLLDLHNISTRALVARCNIAMITFRQGNTDAASRLLKRLISRYGLVCFSRSVFDEAPGLEHLFQHAIDDSRITLPIIFTDMFRTLLATSGKLQDKVQPEHLLTDKEFEVFELLSSGLSNAEISKQSGIALSTTKWHLKNIYSKLGVENRSAAQMLAHKTQTA
jgi:ATP/maltotriose-dependent transcriptional regulator MalT